MNRWDLDSRSQAILRQAVHTFIAFGEPVGSRTLAKVNPQRLSPATIRNIMSDLEDRGFLHQPHISAGRLPTDKGYRFYVSTLVKGAGLSESERKMIGASLRGAEKDLESLVQQTSHLLSHMTDMISFVIGPDFERSILRHVDFVRLASHRILVVLVSQTGQVYNRAIEIPEDLPGEELQECARYLEAEFRGFTLVEAREALLLRMREMRAIYNRLVKNALTLGKAAFGEDMPTDVYLEGTSRMLSKPEFKSDIDRARQLLTILEQKGRLVRILNACLEGDRLQIVIGSETRVPDFKGISLIAARYGMQNRELGALGIMGPSRMEYAKLISVVDYIARSLSEAISQKGSGTAN
ncbi:MAG: heat-inducible transcriptional repressor HrcA [Acidobacteriota bacterium]